MTTPSKKLSLLAPLLLAGALCNLATPLHADAQPLIEDAHHQLAQALNTGGPTPSDADRTEYLKAALKDLTDLHVARGRYDRARRTAREYIKTALDEISQGDPGHQAQNDIRDADSAVRDIEG